MKLGEEARQAAKTTAINRSGEEWMNGICDGLKGIEIPGDLDELAKAERASIEADGTLNVFVAEWEEGVTFTPDELRKHAFELLALAELAEAAS